MTASRIRKALIVTLFKKWLDKHPDDIDGVVVHELEHAIQRVKNYDGELVWLNEGLADFVRFRLAGGEIQSGDPHDSYKVAASFYNWMYQLPDNKRTFYTFVQNVEDGTKPPNLDALLRQYNNGGVNKILPQVKDKGILSVKLNHPQLIRL